MEINALTRSLSPRDCLRLQEQLLELLSWQTVRYTCGDSTSIPLENAQELLQSIWFCLGLDSDPSAARLSSLVNGGVRQAFEHGLRQIQVQLDYGQQLWQSLCANLPPVQNRSMLDTLRNLKGFWRRYDYRFFAHQIPCDIDYQLALPVPDCLCGVEYVNRYLEHLEAEFMFLSCFPPKQAVCVLEHYCSSYQELLVNLFEPVAANALGLILLGSDPVQLVFSKNQLHTLYELLCPLSPAELHAALHRSAEMLDDYFGLCSHTRRDYLTRYAGQLSPRIISAVQTNGLSGIFPGP